MHTREIGADQSTTANRVAGKTGCIKDLLAGILCPAILRIGNRIESDEKPNENGLLVSQKNADHLSPAFSILCERDEAHSYPSLRLYEGPEIRINRYRLLSIVAVAGREVDRVLQQLVVTG